jgi:hypothetical protein
MIKNKSKFYRVHLKTAEAKMVYDAILTALENKQTEVLLENSLLSKINYSIDSIVMYVRMDNPGLFYVDFQQYHYLNSFARRKIVFTFLYSVEKIVSIERQIRNKINVITSTIYYDKPFEIEYAFHDWLVANVTYEHKDTNYHKAHSAVGAILHGRAVCEGYAMAFKLLCDSMGISNIVVYGEAINPQGKNENHAWNIVKLNRKCYHIDVTWDSCTRSKDMRCHSHLNITDEDISQDHTWNRNLLPKCNETEDNYFIRNGRYFLSLNELRTYLVTGIKKGDKIFEFKLKSELNNETELTKAIHFALQSSLKGFIQANLFGSSYQIQISKERGTAIIIFE